MCQLVHQHPHFSTSLLWLVWPAGVGLAIRVSYREHFDGPPQRRAAAAPSARVGDRPRREASHARG